MRALRAPLKTICQVAGLAVVLGLAGCGSSKPATTATTSPAAASIPSTTATSAVAKAGTYTVHLTHVNGSSGSAGASGTALLTVKPASGEVCWSVSPIQHFTVSSGTTHPTIVTIQPSATGTPSTPGIPLAFGGYTATGCRKVPAPVLARAEANPSMFYLSIYNTQSGEAVRGQV